MLLAPTQVLVLDDRSSWFNGPNFTYNQFLSINVIMLHPIQFLELEYT